MHKSFIGIAAATGIGLASLAVPSAANAYCTGCAVGAGVIGGIAAGAIIGNAIANSPPPPPAYYPPPPPPPGAYYPPPPAAYYPPPRDYAGLPPGCHWSERPHRVWVEGVGYRMQPVAVCH